MKRLILFTICVVSFLFVKAQETPKFIYCQIIGTQQLFSTKVTVTLDYGQRMKWMTDYRMKDSIGNTIVFNSMIDAMNHLGKQGWEFAQAYAVSQGNAGAVYYYLMKKPFAELNEKERKEVMK